MSTVRDLYVPSPCSWLFVLHADLHPCLGQDYPTLVARNELDAF